ncbi:MAG: 16S rRNA (uracil(1498)-N(3))-methyltransferase [Mycoplasma sp.]|nr:16S rRNA (uracil(1498)-N(3))-methyltransferase [Mycoplasma sp.]
MFRFFVTNKIDDNFFELSDEVLKHIKVIRSEKEKFICIFEGKFYICKLEDKLARILEPLNESHEHNGRVIIAAALINIKRFEWLIQKAAELGATELIPILTKRVIKKNNDFSKKIIRWNQISKNASEQSFRNVKMIVSKPINFNDALKIDVDNKYISHEKNKSKVPIEFPTNSIFFIGPEGGFTEEEISIAKEFGCQDISLGTRILRSETASIFILSRIKA